MGDQAFEKDGNQKSGEMARQVQEMLKLAMPQLAKHHLEELTTQIRAYYCSRYAHSKNLKYGNLNKGFTEQELQAFFFAIDNDEFKLIFEYMANLGFRIGEVVKVNIADINFETREIRLKSEKSRKLDSLIIPIPLFQETEQYAKLYEEQIKQNDGYLFFRDANRSKRPEPWIEPNYVRKKFREYVRLASLDETYGTSDEHESNRATRTLHRLTSHSLRHFAISRFSRKTNGNLVLTSKFARHSNPNTTMIYIHSDKKELFDVIDSISANDITDLKRELIK
jgi:integrase